MILRKIRNRNSLDIVNFFIEKPNKVLYIYVKDFLVIDKRKDQRIPIKFVVSYSDSGFEKMGITLNLSPAGMCVMSQSTLPINRTVLINLAMLDNVYEILGLVKWSKIEMGLKKRSIPVGLGIKILNAPDGYFNCLENFSK